MLETLQPRKNKITLSDYNYQHDIDNRLLMAQFSSMDLDVLEEILYSSVQIPIRKLARNLNLAEETIFPILERLSKTGLFTYDDTCILVDKEMRKYYESQLVKFDEDFTPGMEYLLGLLRKVPIQFLPTWYAIPRTSNNIFESIIEKYLLTPHIFQRYLSEIQSTDPLLGAIAQDVFNAPDFRLSAQEIIDKHELTREEFEECMLLLEFHFLACLRYTKIGNQWKEMVSPFHEWEEYLRFLRDTDTPTLHGKVQRQHPSDFGFVEDLSKILTAAKKKPLSLPLEQAPIPCSTPESLNVLVNKLCLLKFADVIQGRLYALEAANEWLEMTLENRAHYLYRHTLNCPNIEGIPAYLCAEKTIREAEKSIIRVLHKGWVDFEAFLKGVMIPLHESSPVMLQRVGKMWKYAIPEYQDAEKALIRAVVLQWLFEAGITATGKCEGKDCLSVTSFGKILFN